MGNIQVSLKKGIKPNRTHSDGFANGFGIDAVVGENPMEEIGIFQLNSPFFHENPLGILVADFEHRKYFYANPSICRMLGYTAGELCKMHMKDIHPVGVGNQVRPNVNRLVRGEKTSLKNVPCLRKDGTIVYTDVLGVPIKILGRDYVIGFFTDITPLKDANNEVTRLASIVEDSNDAIIGISFDGIVITWNRGAEKLYGYSKSDIIDKPISIILPWGETNYITDGIHSIRQGNAIPIQDAVHRRKDGQLFHVSITFSIVKNDRDEAICVSLICHDVTPRKQLEETLRDSERRLTYREKHLMTVMDNASIGMFSYDLKGKFIRVNQKFCRMLQYSREELQTKTLFDITHPNNVECIRSAVEGLTNGTVPFVEIEKQFIRKDGQTLDVLLKYLAIFENGAPLYFVGYCQNFTEQKRSELASKEKQTALEIALEFGNVNPWTLDVDTRELHFTQRWIHSMGYSFDKRITIADMLSRYIHPKDADNIYNQCKLYVEGKVSIFEADYRIRNKQGDWIWRRLVGKAIAWDSQGKPTKLLGVSTDIAGYKKFEADNKQLVQCLKENKEAVDALEFHYADILKRFLAVAKGPLTGIEKGAFSGDPNTLLPLTKSLKDAFHRLDGFSTMLSEYANFARSIQSQEHVPFKELADRAASQFVVPLRQRGIHLSITRDRTALIGHPLPMERVIFHLLSNAIKFSNGQLKPRIDIGIRKEANEFICFVKDNGIGIESKDHQRIFASFEKVNSETEGYGMGLAIVKRIIQTHNGRIWVESEGKNKGTTFCFTLPPSDDPH